MILVNLKKRIESIRKRLIPIWKKYHISNWIWSILFVFSCNYYLLEQAPSGTRSIINIVLLLLCMIVFNKYDETKYENKKIPFILAFNFSLSLVIGKVLIENSYDLTILFDNSRAIVNSILGKSIITVIGFTKMFETLSCMVLTKIKEINIESKKIWKLFEKKYFFFIIWAVIFLSWIPAFLAYYPGIISYDGYWVTNQAYGQTEYTKFHPPLHTYIWHLCVDIGNGIGFNPLALYGIIQMILLSFVIAKIIKFLIDRKTNNWLIVLSILFFTINPIIAIFSLVMVKDVYFAMFFVLFVLEFIKLIEKPEEYLKKKLNFIKFGLITAIMCLFRNNAFYAYIICMVVLLVALRKYWKKLIVLLLIPIILYMSVDSFIYPKLGVLEGDKKEALSVPIQQIACVVNRRDIELPSEKKEEINKFFSYGTALMKYKPRWADPVKDTINKEYFEENLDEFRGLWFELMKEYPIEYISAFLSLNLSYWYFDSNTSGIDARYYIEDMLWTNNCYKTERESKAPKLLEKYQKIASFESFEKVPLVSNIFSITTPFWLIIFTLCVLLYKKRYKYVLTLVPMLSLWLTYMAGPTSNFRYIFPIIVLYPILILFIFENDKEEELETNKAKMKKEIKN